MIDELGLEGYSHGPHPNNTDDDNEQPQQSPRRNYQRSDTHPNGNGIPTNTPIPNRQDRHCDINSPHHNKHKITPGRLLCSTVNFSRRIALKTLGLTESASKREVKLKYKLLARKYHPNKWCTECEFSSENAETIFKEIANAYSWLIQN